MILTLPCPEREEKKKKKTASLTAAISFEITTNILKTYGVKCLPILISVL